MREKDSRKGEIKKIQLQTRVNLVLLAIYSAYFVERSVHLKTIYSAISAHTVITWNSAASLL